jgi:hypothetical protein
MRSGRESRDNCSRNESQTIFDGKKVIVFKRVPVGCDELFRHPLAN